MTQAYNLSQLANNLNTTGQLDATDGLVNAVPPANGGTGLASYHVGDLIYATGATTLASLADVAAGNALISGGISLVPSYGKIGLTTHVSGTLAAGNGGTGAATLAANNVLLGNGTGALQVVAPSTIGNVLSSNGTTWVSAATAANPRATIVTASGTFTIPAGVTKMKVTVVGGGGAGKTGTGGCGSFAGGGGGGGGTAIKFLSGLTPGNTLTVTRGAGGTTDAGTGGTSSVASGTQIITTFSATGGAGGVAYAGGGSAGGTGSAGDLNIGGSGSACVSQARGQTGGASSLGGGGVGTATTGGVGRAYGGGGSGGSASGGAPYAGGAGAAGVIIFEY